MKLFETKFLDGADTFLSELDPKIVKKVLYNIDLAEQTTNPKLLITNNIVIQLRN
jgi:hypothetical protein